MLTIIESDLNMCQLLGMNCNVPTDICFSFEGFQARGGKTDIHRDGWGIGFFEGNGSRLFIDVKPSCESAIAQLVRNYPIRSLNTIAHIRKATHGEIKLKNTHPFQRELWGNYWVFAHNGELKNFNPALSGQFQPVGDTDSELAFCYLLDRLARRFSSKRPTLRQIYAVLNEVSNEISKHGMFNYLLTDGTIFFAHCTTNLHYIIRKAPFKKAHLIDEDVSVDFAEVTTPNDIVTIIASEPLTDNEDWIKLSPNELILFKDGLPMFS